MENISVINGKQKYSSQYSYSNGGGVFCSKNMELIKCKISHNNAYGDGGGAFVMGSALISYSTISDNKVYGASSGGGFTAHGNTTVESSTIINNSTGDETLGDGGGFYSAGVTNVMNSTISKNEIKTKYGCGGGFYSRKETTVVNSTFNDNVALGSRGAGAGFCSKASVNLDVSTLTNNRSSYDAGGFYSEKESIVSNSKFLKNHANHSAGGFGSDSTVEVVNSIFLNNTANGGAIFRVKKPSFIINNTFIGNGGSATAKGVFINNIFSNNSTDITLLGASKIFYNYVEYSKIENSTNYVIKKQNIRAITEEELYIKDDNISLTSSSPLIDKGLNPNSSTFKSLIDNAISYKRIKNLLKQDYFGNQRVINNTIDMGAMEYGSVALNGNRKEL